MSWGKNPQALFTWGQDGLQNHTEDDTMKNINYHKTSPLYSCPWRCKSEPSRERTGLSGEKKERKRSAEWKQKRDREGKKGRKKQERRKSWKKAPCQALETVIHGDHLSKLQQNNAFVAINHTCVCICICVGEVGGECMCACICV